MTRGQPEGQAACEVLDQNANETLKAAQNSAVQHDGAVFRAILTDIGGVQTFGQNEIHLQRAALPIAPNGIGQHEFQFRAVKCPFAGIQLIGISRRFCGGFQCRFGLVPNLIAACAGVGAVREFHAEFLEPKILVNRRKQFDELLCFILNLRFAAEDMRVILGKAAHPHNTVQGT